jgi:hypothetical protein
MKGRENEGYGTVGCVEPPLIFGSVVSWDGFPDGGSGGEQERERSGLTSSGQTGWG